VLNNPTLVQHHQQAVSSVMFIVKKALGADCLPYLAHIIPALLAQLDPGTP
jgi:hypothetical protein